jgi:hypothetical protein
MTAMTVTPSRISADEFLAGDYPISSELIDGVVDVNDPTFLHNRMGSRSCPTATSTNRTCGGRPTERSRARMNDSSVNVDE